MRYDNCHYKGKYVMITLGKRQIIERISLGKKRAGKGI